MHKPKINKMYAKKRNVNPESSITNSVPRSTAPQPEGISKKTNLLAKFQSKAKILV